jgi:erythromycin esterase-like protein
LVKERGDNFMDNQSNQLVSYLQPLKGVTTDYDSILEVAQDVDHILIGESTHGTHEFYSIRASITKQLILKKGFNVIAIEGDWPDVYRINLYVKGDSSIKNAIDALSGFKRFPTWMWRNEVVVEFIEWLHQYNSTLHPINKIGFYGLDLYSLNTSMEIIISYLEKKYPDATKRAKERYACFDPFKEDLQIYGYAAMFGVTKSCEDEVVDQLIEFTKRVYQDLQENGSAEDEFFYIKENTRLVKNAEKYYRSMFVNKSSSWNVRDLHMIETLDHLVLYLNKKSNNPTKIVTWAHNSHVGDAKATEVRIQGQLNIGQLAREKYGKKSLLIGFLTNSGSVTAASKWDGIVEQKSVLPALSYSYEQFFHNLNPSNFLINFIAHDQIKKLIPSELLERAIGVIYLPENERESHYFRASLVKQFDIVIYIDTTSAIKPLEVTAIWHKGEVFETFPSGL